MPLFHVGIADLGRALARNPVRCGNAEIHSNSVRNNAVSVRERTASEGGD